jgi:signal transduction histidine kinase
MWFLASSDPGVGVILRRWGIAAELRAASLSAIFSVVPTEAVHHLQARAFHGKILGVRSVRSVICREPAVISYRTLRKLVGETSLERKCRFLFGIALLCLITTSFWWYASLTRSMVQLQQVEAARLMVPRLLQQLHYTRFLKPSGESAPAEGSADTPAMLLDAFQKSMPAVTDRRPSWDLRPVTVAGQDEHEYEARLKFENRDNPLDEHSKFLDEDGSRFLYYYAAIRMEANCLLCHQPDGSIRSALPSDLMSVFNQAAMSGGTRLEANQDITGQLPADAALIEAFSQPQERRPLYGIATITLPMDTVDSQLAHNRAVLLATAILTSFLAMLAAWAIVRFIIVRPVQHLKDVSDEIARGNLNLRADISTGDEFEELSHAFNRMLRHMMTVNDELRSLNENLDAKIDQLAQANMELFNNNRLKDDFLATISHELRTPLNSILGFSDILQTAPNLDARQRRYVSNIQTSGQSLMVQINDLLDLAKIESGKMDIHPDAVRLEEILELQVQQMLPLADRRRIDLRMDAPRPRLPELIQDRGKISQIVNNLLSNAIKFTPEGGRVRVSSRMVDAATVSFSVEDTGIGIPLQEQEHIFEKFRQGSTAPGGRDHTTREYEGTGLGLSIVRELSRLLGGDVSLVSEFGKGSVFSVRLPVEVPLRKAVSEPAPESRPLPSPPTITSSDLLTNTTAPVTNAPAPPRRTLDIQTIGGSR